jgi:hypothetical protein
VGSGSKINTWEDHWIPNNLTRKVMTPWGHIVYTTMDELINTYTNVWDEELIWGLLVDA